MSGRSCKRVISKMTGAPAKRGAAARGYTQMLFRAAQLMGSSCVFMTAIILVRRLISTPLCILAVLRVDNDFLQPRVVTGRTFLNTSLRGKSDCVPDLPAIALVGGGYHLPGPLNLDVPKHLRGELIHN